MPTLYKDRKNNPIDPDYYETLAMVESSGNPNAKAATSSAAGLYQFTEGTWKDSVKQAGLNYTLKDRFDPNKSRKVVQFLTNQNASYLQKKLGRKPSKGDLYIGHFLGMGGASKLLSADPYQDISSVVSDAALRANKNVFYNKDGSLKTVGDIQNWARTKFNEKPLTFSKDPKVADANYYYNNPDGKLDGSQVATKDPREETEKTQESTAVAQDTDYERLYNQIEQQNNLLLQEREERIAKEDTTTKAQQAQAKLDEKLRQRKFLEDLIMQTGVEYVERAPRESVYDQPQQQVFQDGGQQKPSPELEKYIEDLNNYRPLNSEETANTVRNVGYNLYSYFGGKKDEQLEESPYKPSVNGDENKKYFYRKGMREDVYRDLTSEKVKKDYNHSGEFSDIHKALKANGEDREHNANESFSKNKVGYKGMYNLGSPQSVNTAQFNLGRYTVDAGEDDRGRYISFNDTYDWNGFQKGEPIPFYDRIYEEEWETYKNKK